MKLTDERKYRHYQHFIDVDAFEEAIGFEPERQGKNKHGEPEDIGQCPDPWHMHKNGDTTGKFAINRDKRIYGCFVCGGGSLLDLTMAIRDLPEDEAEEWLYQFSVPIEETDEAFLSEIEEILRQETIAKPVMPYYNENLLAKWTDNLAYLSDWLDERGISDAVAVEARLGFQQDAARMAPGKPGEPRHEPYRGPCAYLPHFWGGRLVGWQQRWLNDDRPKWVQKYTNTTGFPKTETIYNYERVWYAERPVIVCESVATVLFLWSLGYAAVAVFGASVSAEQMRLLRRFTQGLVLAPDNDAPGRKWTNYSPDELSQRRPPERVLLAEYLAHFVPVRVMEPVGAYDSAGDLGDLLEGGPQFAAKAVKVLYEDAEYY